MTTISDHTTYRDTVDSIRDFLVLCEENILGLTDIDTAVERIVVCTDEVACIDNLDGFLDPVVVSQSVTHYDINS